ncbi:MAG: hypothetical protein GXX80_13980 [Thermotogaceae bacterium]|nr:hypothetical protein [Thermotogaceae bacterium]
MSLHTAGTLLEWHPHLHVMALDGAFAEDGSFVELPEIDEKLIEEFFSEKVLEFLLKRELLDEETVLSMKSWEHSGFHFYGGEAVEAEDRDARLFLGRYLKKPGVGQSRLSVAETTEEPGVVYRHPELDEEGEVRERRFRPLEFLAELSLHVPKIFEQTGFIKHWLLRY